MYKWLYMFNLIDKFTTSNSLDLTRNDDESCSNTSIDIKPSSSSNSTNGNSQNYSGHVCNNFVIYYKCYVSDCQGSKMYNRLNFFVRHLQLDHQISDFKKVKEIIENSTFEKRKTKKKSRIRAKTLEGLVDDTPHQSSEMRQNSYNKSKSRRSRKRKKNSSDDSYRESEYSSYKVRKEMDDFIDNGNRSSNWLYNTN